MVTPWTDKSLTLPWIVASTKLAEVRGRRRLTSDRPAATVATPLLENAATPSTFSAGPPLGFSARTPAPRRAAVNPCTPVVPAPVTPTPESANPLTPIPVTEVPYTPQPAPACEPYTPIPSLPVPSFWPRTAAEKGPGVLLVISP